MDENLNQLENLLTMFDNRDEMWARNNRQIAKVVAPTVLEALYELFDLDTESIEWVDLQITENIMLIVCHVTYDPATTQSAFLQRVDEAQQPGSPIQVQRYLRIGVPLAIVFSPKDTIKEFLMRVPVDAPDEDDELSEAIEPSFSDATPVIPPVSSGTASLSFDTSRLSEEQLKQMLLYSHTAGTTKQ